jgi:phospholipid/cholesterol/gamma-HCH transport system ATP-binding protein
MAADPRPAEPVLEIEGVHTRFGPTLVHQGVSLEVRRGEVFALAGASGCGKSTLLREIILLLRPDAGSIRLLGQEVVGLGEEAALALRRRCGVMFERGALFGALTVAENVGLPLREQTGLSSGLVDQLAALKIALAGLPPGAGALYPSQLSGGMRKRAALARAIALDPEILFLDEPTAGLDPLSAAGFDDLVRHLKQLLGPTIVIVSHDLDLLWRVADRVAFMADGTVVGVGTMEELSRSEHPVVRQYFVGPRGRGAMEQSWKRR